ncbi:hypothetical protein M0651_18750 [Paenibacillus sp. MBLB2552]|uniref:Glycosytransferase n=1 Tax=Paenibacillus mellifer TaxID=2937794 RepID=A0A9X2BUM0_9BACL|nr:hypothetical protein [Paenibacillus mellifer]MCK8489216.1 hypothetical protein [Paenibacillus mellifer]
MKEKRILWLLNHDTLSKFELPLIRDLGFEIFTPKVVLKEILQASGSITYEYDCTLTLPDEELQILNNYDFTSEYEMPLQISNIINKYFSTAITYTDTSFSILRKLIHNFKGNIFFRAFGVGASRFKNYSELIDCYFTNSDKYKLQQIRGRFWFSQCYPNLADVEENIYKENAVYMPLGLPKEFYEVENKWTGEWNKLLFFCTRINYVPEAKKIYDQFIEDFRGFDYLIAGNQPVPVEDERVTGFLERDELNELYTKSKVMYYHSTDTRHLHYHPLEAMIAGMPVVYMEGSLLSFLGGERQTGRCKDVKEAKRKVQRILQNDTELIEGIISDQKVILDKFSYTYNKILWEQNFLPIIKDSNFSIEEHREVAVFMPHELEKGHIVNYLDLAKSLNVGLKMINENYNMVLNIYKNEFTFSDDYLEIPNDNISIREYDFKVVSASNTSNSLDLMFKDKSLWFSKYIMPVDYAKNFVDADMWLFLYGQLEHPIAPIKPYGLYIENIGERFYRAISPIEISNLKNASFIFTHSQQVKKELVKHIGIREDKIYLIPFVASEKKNNTYLELDSDFVLVEMDLKKPDLVTKYFNDICDYFRLVNNGHKIKIYLNNISANQSNYKLVDDLNEFVQSSELLKNNIYLYVNLDKGTYEALYARASMVIFPYNIENISFKVSLAANYSKKIYLHDFLFYRDIEKELSSTLFNYTKFNLNKNVIAEVLIKNDKNEKIVSTLNIEMPISDDIVANIWRELL